jgi:hypothetical protein
LTKKQQRRNEFFMQKLLGESDKPVAATDEAEYVDFLETAVQDLIEEVKGLQTAPENYQDRYIVLQIPESSKMDLKDYRAYIIQMPVPFAHGDEEPFTRYIVVTRREYSKEFVSFSFRVSLPDGVSRMGDAAKTWFAKMRDIPFDGEMVPCFVSVFTYADVAPFLDTIIESKATLSADDLRILHEEVLERIIVDMQADHLLAKGEVATAKHMAAKFEEAKEDLEGDLQEQVMQVNTGITEMMERQKATLANLEPRINLKIWQFLLLMVGWFVALFVLGIFIKGQFMKTSVDDTTTTTTTTTTMSIITTLWTWVRTFLRGP